MSRTTLAIIRRHFAAIERQLKAPPNTFKLRWLYDLGTHFERIYEYYPIKNESWTQTLAEELSDFACWLGPNLIRQCYWFATSFSRDQAVRFEKGRVQWSHLLTVENWSPPAGVSLEDLLLEAGRREWEVDRLELVLLLHDVKTDRAWDKRRDPKRRDFFDAWDAAIALHNLYKEVNGLCTGGGGWVQATEYVEKNIPVCRAEVVGLDGLLALAEEHLEECVEVTEKLRLRIAGLRKSWRAT